MKCLIAILLVFMSLSFVAEKVVLAAAPETCMVQAEESSPDAGEEQNGSKGLEDLKEKYHSSGLTQQYAAIAQIHVNDAYHLQHYPSGFINKPYMPPEVI